MDSSVCMTKVPTQWNGALVGQDIHPKYTEKTSIPFPFKLNEI